MEVNYQIATRHYSYSVLRNQLNAIIKSFFGDNAEVLTSVPAHPESEGYLYIYPQLVLYKHYNAKSVHGQPDPMAPEENP